MIADYLRKHYQGDFMGTKFYIALLIGLLIYIGAVSGLYLVYKPNLDYQKKKKKEMKEARQKALELAREAKKFNEDHKEDKVEDQHPQDKKNK
jgi:uncharacterized iron-regulated membrane protein